MRMQIVQIRDKDLILASDLKQVILSIIYAPVVTIPAPVESSTDANGCLA